MSDKKGLPPTSAKKPSSSSLGQPRTPPRPLPQLRPGCNDGSGGGGDVKETVVGEDKGAVLEYLLTVFESPSWTEPLAAFIEEYCVLFEAEASEGAQAAEDKECQFIHTRVHELFKDLVESLLCEHLDRVGVDLEDFLLACDAVSKKEQGIGQQAMDHLLAMEDFMTFKHLMVKRNLELELAEIESLLREEEEGKEEGVGGLQEEEEVEECVPEPLTPEEEEEHLEMALRASFEESHGSGDSGNDGSTGAAASSLSGLGPSSLGTSSLSTPSTSLEGVIQAHRLSSLTLSSTGADAPSSSSLLSSSSSSSAPLSSFTAASSLSRTAQPPSSLASSSLSASRWREAAEEEESKGISASATSVAPATTEGSGRGVEEVKGVKGKPFRPQVEREKGSSLVARVAAPVKS